MAGLDFSTILAALGGTDKAAAESDPFAGLSDFGTSLAGTVLKTALPAGGPLTQYSPYATIPKYDIGGGIAAGLASGLLSGVADNLSEGYKTRQEDLAHQALTSVFSGNPLSRPDGMSPSVFSAVQKISDAQTISDTQEEADRKQRLTDAITLKQTAAGKEIIDPYSADFKTQHGLDPNATPAEVRQALHEEDKNRLPPKTIEDLSHGATLTEDVKSLSSLIDQMSESSIADSTIGAAERTYKSMSLDNPEGRYLNKVKYISDALTKQFAGRASFAAIQQMAAALTPRQIGSKAALKEVVNNLAATLEGENSQRAESFGQAGYDALDKAKTLAAPQQLPDPLGIR